MRNSILTIALAFFTLVNVNALNRNNDETVSVYQWKVETTEGVYSGTSPSLEQAQAMAYFVSKGQTVTGKIIESYELEITRVKEEEQRIYYWEVAGQHVVASGTQSSLIKAQEIVDRLNKSGNLTYKIIESESLNK